MSEIKHTPTPWSLAKSDDGIWNIRWGDDYVGTCMYMEDMRHIVTAVNAYDKQRALIETLTDSLQRIAEDWDEINKWDGTNKFNRNRDIARAALAALAAAKEQSA